MDLTQEQAAERCRMLMQQFQRLESGRMSPTLRTISRVTEGLEIDAQELFVPLKKGR
jgi:transcriptional regulator with XRE-family HTH domain